MKIGSTGLNEHFVIPLLRGCGQLFFQPSALTGSVFLLLILAQSTASFMMCAAGVLGSTVCAYSLEHPRNDYYQGLGGFNGGLVGLALSVFYQFSGMLLVIAFVAGVLTGMVRVLLVKILPFPPFTTPFISVAWLVFLGGDWLGIRTMVPPVIEAWQIYGLTTNASQVLFLLHPWIGVLVLAAVLLHSRIAALWVAAASLVAWLAALVFVMPEESIAAGLLGYNGLILAAALQHRDTPALLAAAGVVLSVWLTHLLLTAGITPLSAPFVLSAWMVIAVETMLARRRLAPR